MVQKSSKKLNSTGLYDKVVTVICCTRYIEQLVVYNQVFKGIGLKALSALKGTVYCFLFAVKKFRCLTFLPLFPEKLSQLQLSRAFIMFTCTHPGGNVKHVGYACWLRVISSGATIHGEL